MKRGLGKGLDALFEEINNEEVNPRENKSGIAELNIMDLDPNPNQARKAFDGDRLNELAESIRQHGVVQPVIVKPVGTRYRIVAGERRWRAARLAGLTTIPAVIMDKDEKSLTEISLIENLQREDLNPIEEAQGIKQLIEEYSLTQEQIAATLSKSRPAIANSIRLLNLSGKIQNMLIDNRLTAGHARALLSIDDTDLRDKLADIIVEKELNVRDCEKLIKTYQNKRDKAGNNIKRQEKPAYMTEIESVLEEALGTRVEITPGKKKGVIQIEYYNNDDLERIIEWLTRNKEGVRI